MTNYLVDMNYIIYLTITNYKHQYKRRNPINHSSKIILNVFVGLIMYPDIVQTLSFESFDKYEIMIW